MPISKINTTSITDNSVTAGKIVAGAVDADIAAGSIDTAQIADDAVTADKLANAINTSIAVGAAALPKAGGTMTGTIADFRSTGIDDNSNALAMTIDVNENIGLGSVPATDWHANYSVLQLGGQSGFWTHKAVGTGKALHISHNTEYDTGFKYIASDEASLYMQGDGGKHIFSTAAAGTAGNAISFTTAMTIDNAGIVTKPLQPAFSAYGSNQSISTNTDVDAVLPNEEFDAGNNFNTSTSRFTAPVAGKYLFTGTIEYFGTGTSHIAFRVNGSFVNNGWSDFADTKAAVQSRILNLAAGDYVNMRMYSNIAGATNGVRTRMTGCLLS